MCFEDMYVDHGGIFWIHIAIRLHVVFDKIPLS